jgi:hypothetical protein
MMLIQWCLQLLWWRACREEDGLYWNDPQFTSAASRLGEVLEVVLKNEGDNPLSGTHCSYFEHLGVDLKVVDKHVRQRLVTLAARIEARDFAFDSDNWAAISGLAQPYLARLSSDY